MDIGLILFLTITSATTIYGILDKWSVSAIKKRILILILCGGAIYGGFYTYYAIQRSKTIDALTNSIFNITDTSIVNDFIVQIGKSGPTFFFPKTTTFGFPGTPLDRLFKIYMEDHRLSLEMVVRNSEGKVIAAIQGTNWEVFDNDYEFNSDDSAFEIVTKGERKVYFQIDLREKIAHIAGMFFIHKNEGAYFYEDPSKKDGFMVIITPKSNFGLSDVQVDIPRIFKYPRAIYSKVEGIRK